MKSKMNIKSIVIMAILGIISLFFINMSLAANTAKITVETANLRETADANSKILVQLSQNQEVEIVEEAGEWYKVKSNNITGYVRGGCSPLGMKKPYPVVFDASAGNFSEIYVSGGRIGLTLKVPLEDLLKVTGGKLADITMKQED